MPSWIDIVVESMQYAESPKRYYWWAAATCIAATAKKNVYLDRFMYKLYPNMYVMLVSAGSGLRKGAPVAFVNSILHEVGNTKVIGGRNTIQSVIRDLSQQTTLENGTVLSEAQGILVADEFAAFLQGDDSAMTILTGLYNTHEHVNGWKNSLKGSPVEVLKNPCVSMIGASNEVLLNDVIQGKDIEGGFVARTFIVWESKRRTINPLMERPEGIIPKKELAQYLKEVAKLRGEFKMTDKSRSLYSMWYNQLANSEISDRTGSIERLGDQVLKVCMILSMSHGLSMEIDVKILEEAIHHTQECFLGVRRVATAGGKAESSQGVARILKELVDAPGHSIGREALLRKCWPDIDSVSLDRVIDTLEQAGAITSEYKNKQYFYTMKEDIYQQYTSFQTSKQNQFS